MRFAVEWLSGRGKQEEPSVIATLTLSCADITKSTFPLRVDSDCNSVLFNNNTVNFFHRESICWDSDTSFRIENTSNDRVTYSVIIQRMDGLFRLPS